MKRFNVRYWTRRFIPFMLCCALILCHLIPTHFLPNYPYAIQWVFIPIFYFAIYNPKCLSSWAVFILGIISELLVQSPFGVTTFCYVLLFFVANFLRKYLIELTFVPLWVVFAAVLLGIELLDYLLVLLLSEYPVGFSPVLVEFWILTFIYPFLMRFCAHFDRKVREAAV